jgi:hypothetical protein
MSLHSGNDLTEDITHHNNILFTVVGDQMILVILIRSMPYHGLQQFVSITISLSTIKRAIEQINQCSFKLQSGGPHVSADLSHPNKIHSFLNGSYSEVAESPKKL